MKRAAVIRLTGRIAKAMRRKKPLPLDPFESAKLVSLRYVDDSTPGIRRIARGKGFAYVRPDGSAVRDKPTLKRIRGLVIPPAWTNVWICPSPDGHLQATGRDARGRKQYRYHPRFRQIRDETKYERMIAFAEALPRIRARVDEDMTKPALCREKVLATIVRLLEITLIRVGNEEYARANASFGLTTLRSRHVDIEGSSVRFHFRGKSGIKHEVEVVDRRVAKVVSRCTDLPGQILFQYVDEAGQVRNVESSDVNGYLREIANADFTAKDFRTWAGTVLAAKALAATDASAAPKKNLVAAIKDVANRLGNTAAVCRKCYVHPAIVDAYLAGALKLDARAPSTEGPCLSADESAVLALLRAGLDRHEAA
jgi:DNA topoisomerase I